MDLSNLLKPERIALKANFKTKGEVINFLLNLANKSGLIVDLKSVKEEILKREREMTTAIGKGIAIPHAKSKNIKGILASACVLETPIDFDALDNQPVQLCFLILGNEANIGQHLRILSKISRIMDNDEFRDKLINSRTEIEFLKLFNDYS
jgi:fructose-specific phosphotransferase system IIA component